MNASESITSPRPPVVAVFLILLASYAYFWHARDWNSDITSNADVRDRRSWDGFDRRVAGSNSRSARIRGRYFSDKLPGFSLLGTLPYAVSRAVLHLPPHPTNRPGFAYWPADYWVTLATSGLATALCVRLLTNLAARLGCGPRSCTGRFVVWSGNPGVCLRDYELRASGRGILATRVVHDDLDTFRSPERRSSGRFCWIPGSLGGDG